MLLSEVRPKPVISIIENDYSILLPTTVEQAGYLYAKSVSKEKAYYLIMRSSFVILKRAGTSS